MVRYFLYFLAFAALRVQLLRDFPVLLTNDSWDYIASASSIARHASFSSDGDLGLRDCRTPGYPVFLAVFSPLTHMRSDRIALLQAGIGLFIPLTGWAVGRALESPRAGEALTLFLGLNPIYLLYEHSLMSESLSLFLILAYTTTVLFAWTRGPSLSTAVFLGTLFGFNVLVRINTLPFCATLTAGLCLFHLAKAASGKRAGVLAFALACGLSSSVVIGPWIYRNYRCYQELSLNMSQKRALLVYKSMHDSFDVNLPRFRQERQSLNCWNLDYTWFWRLSNRYGVSGAERIAGELLNEQWQAHPKHHFRDAFRALLSFGGYHNGGENDLAPVRYWFDHLVGDVSRINRIHADSESIANRTGFTYVATRGDSPWTKAWQQAGSNYLATIRPILFASFFGALTFRWIRKRSIIASKKTRWAIACLSAAYLATAAFHALTLTDSDRFATVYDWAPLLVVFQIPKRGQDPFCKGEKGS